MRKTILAGLKHSALALAAAFTCTLAFATPTFSGPGAAPALADGNAAVVLYSQNGTDAGIGILSQLFDSCYDAYDSAAADDFVATGTWVVTEVDTPGRYLKGSGPSESEYVTFYKNKRGLPGAVVRDIPFVHGKDDGTGSFSIRIPPTKLKPGTYWVSVQAFMNFYVGGEWGWESQTTVVGHPAAWENSGQGFGYCATWGRESTCVPDGQGDHVFTLRGKSH